jgi:hypothetical protein
MLAMRNEAVISRMIAAIAGTLLLLACQQEQGAAIQEEGVASGFRNAAASALENVTLALEALKGDSPSKEVVESLERAEVSVRDLASYYVPLLDARERAYRAYRLYHTNRRQVVPELARIEAILKDIARARPVGAVEDALVMVEMARIAAETDDPGVPHAIESLAHRLSLMILKGELVLAGRRADAGS